MSKRNEQTGICAEASPHALFVSLNQTGKDTARLKQAICRFPELSQHYAELYPDAGLVTVIAIGSRLWDQLFSERPNKLVDFPAFSNQGRVAPSTPVDIWLHIRSQRHDVNYIVAKAFADSVSDQATVVEEVHGFRYLDSRDLIGFVDGTENPQGEQRAKVALVNDEDESFRAGSYIHVQRYVHDLAAWGKLEVKAQEDIIGRTKQDDIEYASEDKLPSAHTKRTSLKDSEEQSIEILRHSMPYGTTSEAGLYFVSYARDPANFTLMLSSMINGDGEGHHDHLMDYTHAVTGAAFFAPAKTFLTDQIS